MMTKPASQTSYHNFYTGARVYPERIPYGHKAILCIVEPTRILTQREFEEARTRHWNTVEGEVQ